MKRPPLSDHDLEAIDFRWRRATAPNWHAQRDNGSVNQPYSIYSDLSTVGRDGRYHDDPVALYVQPHNADAMANAPRDVADLLAEVRRLRQLVTNYLEALDSLKALPLDYSTADRRRYLYSRVTSFEAQLREAIWPAPPPRMMPGETPYSPGELRQVQGLVRAAASASEQIGDDELEREAARLRAEAQADYEASEQAYAQHERQVAEESAAEAAYNDGCDADDLPF